jgi:hypothetical protein
MDSVDAFHAGNAALRTPREPHAIDPAFMQKADIEACAEPCTKDRLGAVFLPTRRALWLCGI